MASEHGRLRLRLMMGAMALGGLGAAGAAHAEGPTFEVYGFAQVDYIQDFNRVNPAWEDTLRPSRIPTTTGQFGDNGQASFSAKQSRLGFVARQDIAGQPAEVKVDFDFFGVGADEGKTAVRLRHAYGSWGPVLGGQTESVFMDLATFPNVIDYWGPNGMVFLRTPQIRYTYKTGPHEIAVAIEKPGNDVDPGNIRIIDPEIAANISGSEELPDFTAHYRYGADWGDVQIAGILRRVGFDTAGTPNNEPKGHKTGWGLNASWNTKTFGKDVAHLSVVYGEGIASYMNDGGTDLGPKGSFGPSPPIFPVPPGQSIAPDVVPLLGLVLYYDHYWTDNWSSSIGWSETKVKNLSLQAHDAYKNGQYASVNLLWTPESHLMFGVEYLWGQRDDKDNKTGNDNRIQVSAKYSFTSKDFFRQ
jgi:hypothetical protein